MAYTNFAIGKRENQARQGFQQWQCRIAQFKTVTLWPLQMVHTKQSDSTPLSLGEGPG
jgi:hypothetical protein